MISKKKYFLAVIALLVLTIYSCKTKNSSGLEVLKFDFARIDSTFDLSNKIDTFFIVELETRNDVIATIRGKVFLEDDKIFLFDDVWGNASCFSKNGEFLFYPFIKGRGPNEIEMAESMYLDKQEKQLLIIDALRKSIHFIDLEGNYIKEVKVGLYMKDVVRVSEDKFALLLTEPKESSILISDSNFQTFQETKVVLDSYTNRISSGANAFSNNNDGSAIFAFGLYDHVLTLNGEEITKKYFFDFGAFAIPNNIKSINHRELFYMLADKNYNLAGEIMMFGETNNYISFRFMFSPLSRYLYYLKNKKTGKVKLFSYVSLGGNLIKGSWFKKVGDWYVATISDPIENPIIDKKLSSSEINLLNLLKNKNPEDNPTLIFYKMKR
jgi:hypothetical protein